jgi:hypothetical protein
MKDSQQLVVMAHYNDGTSRDVTREAVFATSNFEIATVGKTGLIEAVRRGEAAALVRFEGLYAAAPVTVLGEREGYKWVDSPEYNFVDTHVSVKVRRVKILPSELCTVSEFLRRFVQHVLPRGFVRIRQFWFLSNACRGAQLSLARFFQLLLELVQILCDALGGGLFQGLFHRRIRGGRSRVGRRPVVGLCLRFAHGFACG